MSKMYRWLVHTKGGPYEDTWEISVVREDNKHGFSSYGWYDSRKLHISDHGACHVRIEQFTWDLLVEVAEKVAAKKSADEELLFELDKAPTDRIDQSSARREDCHYKVVTVEDVIALEEQVNENLKNGWRCIGGLCVVPYKDSLLYSQAVMLPPPLQPKQQKSLTVKDSNGLLSTAAFLPTRLSETLAPPLQPKQQKSTKVKDSKDESFDVVAWIRDKHRSISSWLFRRND